MTSGGFRGETYWQVRGYHTESTPGGIASAARPAHDLKSHLTGFRPAAAYHVPAPAHTGRRGNAPRCRYGATPIRSVTYQEAASKDHAIAYAPPRRTGHVRLRPVELPAGPIRRYRP